MLRKVHAELLDQRGFDLPLLYAEDGDWLINISLSAYPQLIPYQKKASQSRKIARLAGFN